MHLCLSTLDIYIYIYRPIYIYTEVRVYIILFLSLSLSPRLYVLNLSACSRAHHNRSALRKQRRKKPHPFQISLNLHLQSLFLCPDLNQLIFSTCLRVSEHSIVVSPHHCLPTEFSQNSVSTIRIAQRYRDVLLGNKLNGRHYLLVNMKMRRIRQKNRESLGEMKIANGTLAK